MYNVYKVVDKKMMITMPFSIFHFSGDIDQIWRYLFTLCGESLKTTIFNAILVLWLFLLLRKFNEGNC